MCFLGHGRKRFLPTFADSGSTIALDLGMAFLFTGLLYVYVVTVNKVPRFLWITPVYRIDSSGCRSHNRMHSVCGSGGCKKGNICVFLPRRRYTVFFYNSSTRC